MAKDRSFMTEAIQIALSDAVRLINEQDLNLLVEDANPLSTPDVVKALTSFKERAALVVLVFDQFEDFVTKPEMAKTAPKANLSFSFHSVFFKPALSCCSQNNNRA